jgi:hypothetical protein
MAEVKIPENGLLVLIDIVQHRDCNEYPFLVMKFLPTISPEDAAMLLEDGFNMICKNIEDYLRKLAGWPSEFPDRIECKILPFKKKT